MSDQDTISRGALQHAGLRAHTPARVDLGRTGVSLPTAEWLQFQLAHAQARDAVQASLDVPSLMRELKALGLPVVALKSAARNRAEYLRRPDAGRKLSPDTTLPQPTGECDVTFVIADGLSSLAVERHAAPLLRAALPLLEGCRIGPVCVVEQGRVAIADEIGAALDAWMAVVLIGERPGLSSPDSLGIYITWEPRPGRTDAERNCISNVRDEGLPYDQAAIRLAYFLREARRLQASGITLKDPSQALQQ